MVTGRDLTLPIPFLLSIPLFILLDGITTAQGSIISMMTKFRILLLTLLVNTGAVSDVHWGVLQLDKILL